jgi:lipoprotein-anchoring transpeptidase ErfK/SrfK
MNSQRIKALQLVQDSKTALQAKDKLRARRLAEQALAIAPDLDEGWMVLAALASPHASIVYLQKALDINPNNEKAKDGLVWALRRLHEEEEKQGQPASEQPVSTTENEAAEQNANPAERWESATLPAEAIPANPYIEAMTKENAAVPPAGVAAESSPAAEKAAPRKIPFKTLAAPHHTILPWLVLMAVVLAALAAWIGVPPIQAADAAKQSIQRDPMQLEKPTLTPTPTATFTPTPTPTNTPTPTPTETPTDTPTPTETPTEVPTDVPQQQAYAAAEVNPPSEVGKHERWIDINLSNQTLAAYEGSELVQTFLVSTGVYNHPTVTGQFHIYVKYRYADMAGPGYFLPDVPYTMYFYESYGLHGTYWHHNFGTPMSHGCVNLETSNAAWLYNWADVGTLVNIHY